MLHLDPAVNLSSADRFKKDELVFRGSLITTSKKKKKKSGRKMIMPCQSRWGNTVNLLIKESVLRVKQMANTT